MDPEPPCMARFEPRFDCRYAAAELPLEGEPDIPGMSNPRRAESLPRILGSKARFEKSAPCAPGNEGGDVQSAENVFEPEAEASPSLIRGRRPRGDSIWGGALYRLTGACEWERQPVPFGAEGNPPRVADIDRDDGDAERGTRSTSSVRFRHNSSSASSALSCLEVKICLLSPATSLYSDETYSRGTHELSSDLIVSAPYCRIV